MKKYEAFKTVRDTLKSKGVMLQPNTATSVGIFSVYDIETEVWNPPFTSDDLSALRVFTTACIDNPNLAIILFRVANFDTTDGYCEGITYEIVNSETIDNIIKANGGIDE